MKLKTVLLTIVALSVMTSAALAKPERMHIKDANRHVKEKTAKGQIKNIDLKNIEDPEARKAIQQIMNYLNLQTK